MNILVIGGGGREHALIWKLAQSPRAKKIYAAPGNGGTRALAENVPIASSDVVGILAFARERKIDLVIVGPDDPLAMGIVDELKKIGVPAFGPIKAAAELEWSKAFAKDFMQRHAIPTADFRTFDKFEEAKAYAEDNKKFPWVIKASGLALGKGVTITNTKEGTMRVLQDAMVDKVFGDAGSEVVIEEFLTGREISIHALSDGERHILFPPAQDHKAAYDGDTGPNTGGMGTVAPLPGVLEADLETIERSIVGPTLAGMKTEGRPFAGILYPGLMMTDRGPKVLEFNARFGDPETQSYMRILDSDLLELLYGSATGALGSAKAAWREGFAACVILASGGYPGKYEKGKKITGIEEAEKMDDVVVFHAGTAYEDGGYYTSGGRVLGVTAYAKTLKDALDRAYAAVEPIRFEGMQYRKDIGQKALKIV